MTTGSDKPLGPQYGSGFAGSGSVSGGLEAARFYWRIGDWQAINQTVSEAALPSEESRREDLELALYSVEGAFMSGDPERGRLIARALAEIPGQKDSVICALLESGFATLARVHLMAGEGERALAATRASLTIRSDLDDTETLMRFRVDADRRYIFETGGSRVRNPLMPRKLFIDCGGHDGCSALKFLLDNPDYECVSFEPNPSFWPHYDGLPTELVKSAVYTYDGEIEFIIDPVDGDGSTLVADKPVEYHGTLTNEECPRLNVKCVDLSQFIAERSQEYASIILKLDIEGAEYDILEKMLADGTLLLVDKLYCEFHGHKMNLPTERHDRIHNAVSKLVEVSPWDAIALSFSSDIKGARRRKLRDFLVANILKQRTH